MKSYSKNITWLVLLLGIMASLTNHALATPIVQQRDGQLQLYTSGLEPGGIPPWFSQVQDGYIFDSSDDFPWNFVGGLDHGGSTNDATLSWTSTATTATLHAEHDMFLDATGCDGCTFDGGAFEGRFSFFTPVDVMIEWTWIVDIVSDGVANFSQGTLTCLESPEGCSDNGTASVGTSFGSGGSRQHHVMGRSIIVAASIPNYDAPNVFWWSASLNSGDIPFTAALHGSLDLTITAVPEPSTLALMVLGLAGLIVVRRRNGPPVWVDRRPDPQSAEDFRFGA